MKQAQLLMLDFVIRRRNGGFTLCDTIAHEIMVQCEVAL
jgi:hypothetical protein